MKDQDTVLKLLEGIEDKVDQSFKSLEDIIEPYVNKLEKSIDNLSETIKNTNE